MASRGAVELVRRAPPDSRACLCCSWPSRSRSSRWRSPSWPSPSSPSWPWPSWSPCPCWALAALLATLPALAFAWRRAALALLAVLAAHALHARRRLLAALVAAALLLEGIVEQLLLVADHVAEVVHHLHHFAGSSGLGLAHPAGLHALHEVAHLGPASAGPAPREPFLAISSRLLHHALEVLLGEDLLLAVLAFGAGSPFSRSSRRAASCSRRAPGAAPA